RIRVVTYGSPRRRLCGGGVPVLVRPGDPGDARPAAFARGDHRQPRGRPDVGLALAQPLPPHRPDRRVGGRRPAPPLGAGGAPAGGGGSTGSWSTRLRPAARRPPAAAHPRALRLPRGPGPTSPTTSWTR